MISAIKMNSGIGPNMKSPVERKAVTAHMDKADHPPAPHQKKVPIAPIIPKANATGVRMASRRSNPPNMMINTNHHSIILLLYGELALPFSPPLVFLKSLPVSEADAS